MRSHLKTEIEHDRIICEHAEEIWGWGTPSGQRRVRRRAERVNELLSLYRNPRILELGTGVGVFAKHIQLGTTEFHAIDISLEMTRQIKKKMQNIKLVQGNIEELPYFNESFDLIFGISVIHHLNAAAALKEVHRVLRNDGRLFLTEPNMLNPQVFVMKKVGFLKQYFGEVAHETAFFKLPMKRMLKACGFQNVQVENFDFLHPSIPKSLLAILEPACIFLEKIPLIKEFSGSLVISAGK